MDTDWTRQRPVDELTPDELRYALGIVRKRLSLSIAKQVDIQALRLELDGLEDIAEPLSPTTRDAIQERVYRIRKLLPRN